MNQEEAYICVDGSKDVQLSYEDDLRRTMLSSIERLTTELRERFEQLQNLAQKYAFKRGDNRCRNCNRSTCSQLGHWFLVTPRGMDFEVRDCRGSFASLTTLESGVFFSLRHMYPKCCGWLGSIGLGKRKCLVCEEVESWKVRFVICSEECPFSYCPECWKDIKGMCYVCSPDDDDDSPPSEDDLDDDNTEE
ncbi:uncharacterized protein TNCV_3761971 [Trichonephila clavipes]|nr:uncharacterized protein TNCV_3761971 [Trichonephila clavipes]